MEIVLTAAKYHDIGRTNDKYDEVHGILSFNKMLQLKLVDKKMEDIHILQFIMVTYILFSILLPSFIFYSGGRKGYRTLLTTSYEDV